MNELEVAMDHNHIVESILRFCFAEKLHSTDTHGLVEWCSSSLAAVFT